MSFVYSFCVIDLSWPGRLGAGGDVVSPLLKAKQFNLALPPKLVVNNYLSV